MAAKHIVLPGGSGFLGQALTERLTARGERVTVLTQGAPRSGQGWEYVHWDGRSQGQWTSVLEGADAVVHLSGKRVDCRPTRRNLDQLVSSRVDTVRAIGEALASCQTAPPVWVQLSSLAIFGEGGDAVIDEQTLPSGRGPAQMVQVCLAWEAAFAGASAGVARTVLLCAGIGGLSSSGAGLNAKDSPLERTVAQKRWPARARDGLAPDRFAEGQCRVRSRVIGGLLTVSRLRHPEHWSRPPTFAWTLRLSPQLGAARFMFHGRAHHHRLSTSWARRANAATPRQANAAYLRMDSDL